MMTMKRQVAVGLTVFAALACACVVSASSDNGDVDLKAPTAVSECINDVVFNMNFGNFGCMKLVRARTTGYPIASRLQY